MAEELTTFMRDSERTERCVKKKRSKPKSPNIIQNKNRTQGKGRDDNLATAKKVRKQEESRIKAYRREEN